MDGLLTNTHRDVIGIVSFLVTIVQVVLAVRWLRRRNRRMQQLRAHSKVAQRLASAKAAVNVKSGMGRTLAGLLLMETCIAAFCWVVARVEIPEQILFLSFAVFSASFTITFALAKLFPEYVDEPPSRKKFVTLAVVGLSAGLGGFLLIMPLLLGQRLTEMWSVFAAAHMLSGIVTLTVWAVAYQLTKPVSTAGTVDL